MLYWSLHHVDVAGGIQITGSHNPPEFNGFKICVGTGSLHGGGIQRLRELLDAPVPRASRATVRTTTSRMPPTPTTSSRAPGHCRAG
ncbi:MAG: hypothetical protein U5K74_03805 [Gemmatimonadaceae bacterium]|nr:hypothetical protein [Gemmatimonadaceae bacterium]